MRDHYITSTALADMHGLAHQGVRAPDHFSQLQDIVRRHLGEDQARLFAKPVPNPGSREIDWYSTLSGEARRFVDLPAEEQAALRRKIRNTAQEIYRCAEAQGPSRSEQMGRHILQLALCCPDEASLWVVGGSPLCVNWGYGPGAPGQEPLQLWELPDPPEPEPEAIPAAAPLTAATAPEPTPAPAEPPESLESPESPAAQPVSPEPVLVSPGQPSGEEPEERKGRFQPNWWWLLPAGLAGVVLFLLMLRMGYPSVQTLIRFWPSPEVQAGKERLAKLEQSLDGLWQDVERRAALCRTAVVVPPKPPAPPPEPPKPPDPAPEPPKPPAPAPTNPCANSQGIEFVLIQPGTFLMGSPDGEGDSRERPQHEVTLTRAFCMGKFEVTQAQWHKVMGNNPSRHKGENHPVDNVSWNDTQAFVKKLNALEGKERFRLPTEAEWEYAARASTTTTYFFGENKDDLTRYDWCQDNAEGKTHPVGQKPANPWGLHDVYCNVDEWVQDRYGAYQSAPVRDPQGPTTGEARIIRGGCYTADGRSAARWDWSAKSKEAHAGLRLALIPAE